MWSINKIFLFLLLFFTIFIVCVKEYNPFEDINNVKVLYSTSFKNKQQIVIFSPETLLIKPLVRERIDSFSVSVPENIFWTDSTITNDSAPFDQSYLFFVSFKDTGKNEIIVTTFLSNTQLSKKIKDQVYVQSPLCQKPISIYLGNYCTLSTPGVNGENVLYNWSFEDNFNISSKSPMHIMLLNTTPAKSDKCSLWVSDIPGIHNSPKVPFQVTFFDTVSPTIVYKNFMGIFNNDTIYSGNTSFIFMTEIYDQGNSAVEKTWINSNPFDYCELSKNLYWNVINNSQRESNNCVTQISIKAMDQYDNETTKDFWLCYDSTLEKNNIAFLTVDNPDTESVTENDYRISGKVYNFSPDSLLLTNVINNTDTLYQSYIIPPDSEMVAWKWDVTLIEGYNNFTIRLQKMNDKSMLIEKSISVFLSMELLDTVSPIIISIMVNDTITYTGSEMFFQEDSIVISVVAIDGISEVDKIFIDNIELSYEVQKQHWSNKVYISHDTTINRLLSVHDSHANKTTRHLTIFQNTKPKLLRNKFIQPNMFIGREYHDSISLLDMENDPLTVTYLINKHWETNGTSLYLKPTHNDTGQGRIIFTVSDGLQSSDTSVWYYAVTEEPVSVEFDSITIMESLFDTILAGSNQTFVNLSAKNGIFPYQYTVILSPVNTVILDTSANSSILWTPLLQDTGNYTLFFYIEDVTHTKDTLFHPIYVKSNYPEITGLTMTVTPDSVPLIGDTIDGSDINDNSQLVLNFFIRTASRGLFSVTVHSQDSLVNQFELDSHRFTIEKLIQKPMFLEVITVTVSDVWSNTRIKKIFLKHNNPSDTTTVGILPSEVAGCIWFDASDPHTVINGNGNTCDQSGEEVSKWKSRFPRDSIELVSLSTSNNRPTFVVNPKAIYFDPQNEVYMEANSDGNFIKNDHHIISVTLLDKDYNDMYLSILSFTDESNELTYNIGYSHYFLLFLDATLFTNSGDPVKENKRFRLYPSKGKYNIINAKYTKSTEKYIYSLNSKQSKESVSCQFSQRDWKTFQLGASYRQNNNRIENYRYGFHGTIAEIIIIPRTLPADSIKGIEEYLADKYNITLTP